MKIHIQVVGRPLTVTQTLMKPIHCREGEVGKGGGETIQACIATSAALNVNILATK